MHAAGKTITCHEVQQASLSSTNWSCSSADICLQSWTAVMLLFTATHDLQQVTPQLPGNSTLQGPFLSSAAPYCTSFKPVPKALSLSASLSSAAPCCGQAFPCWHDAALRSAVPCSQPPSSFWLSSSPGRQAPALPTSWTTTTASWGCARLLLSGEPQLQLVHSVGAIQVRARTAD